MPLPLSSVCVTSREVDAKVEMLMCSVTASFVQQSSVLTCAMLLWVQIGPRVRSALGITKDGYLMITPFTPSDGTPPVLINRGWVPASYKVKFDSGAPEEDGSKRCKLITTLRSSEKPSSFVPDNTDDTWFWIDVPSLAQACGLPRETPMLAVLLPDDADPTNPEYPLGQPLADVTRVSTMPIDHLNYAATWYTLTAAMLYISYRRLHPNMARRMMPSK